MGSGISKKTIPPPPSKTNKLEPRIDKFKQPQITVVLSTNENELHLIPRPMSLQGMQCVMLCNLQTRFLRIT
jgi:hypothetical protein